MNRSPRILGHVTLGLLQQRELVPGATFELPLRQFRETIKWEAHIGDMAWVKEPWCMLMPHAIVLAGHFISLTKDRIPEIARKRGYKLEFHPDGRGLHRRESRFTLEVMGYTPDAGTVRLLVHECQIDHLVESRRAAA